MVGWAVAHAISVITGIDVQLITHGGDGETVDWSGEMIVTVVSVSA